MSPLSRGRKGRKKIKSTRRSDAFGTRDTCDCPVCTDVDFDPQRMIEDLTASAEGLVECEDPLDVEIAGAAFMSIGAAVGEIFDEAVVDGFVPQFEAQAGPGALAMLLATGSVAEGRAGQVALAAADRLVKGGVPRPRWAAELAEPVTVTDCWRLIDTAATASMLLCLFHRAGRSHTVVLSVNHLDCGAADEILLFPVDQLATALEMIRSDGRDNGLEITEEELDPTELRWHVEAALDARAVHDRDERELGTAGTPGKDDGLPDYRALAVLLRARMRALPASSKPPAPHGAGDHHLGGLSALQTLARFADNAGGLFGAQAQTMPRGREKVAKLPTKRKKSDGVAPVYQIKVELRGAKPPIWRRLEVPADISLTRLHTVIQIAFRWYDTHLHVFQTPYGEFGVADTELGHRPEAPVTLEQVAPGARSKIRYTYDFGDDWEHDILVEKVLDREETTSYPRCTGGRRAAPPEDCGGIWGYADLEEVLADPAHPDHDDKLDWLGLDDAAQFDPTDFDAEKVTQALARLAGLP